MEDYTCLFYDCSMADSVPSLVPILFSPSNGSARTIQGKPSGNFPELGVFKWLLDSGILRTFCDRLCAQDQRPARGDTEKGWAWNGVLRLTLKKKK